MSAWMMGNRDLSYLAFAVAKTERSGTSAREIAQALYDQNAASIRYRYADADQHKMIQTFNFVPSVERGEQPQGGELGKLASCYDYQACETPLYYQSDAARWMHRIRAEIVRQLPGYDSGPWGDWKPAAKRAARGVS